ncbi:MAG: DUF2188 domain-containing protein [candidate division WOR-3 bacterium]|nr:DUF2188 domain-containing protein [candidate division WOR-3 bacterium]
MAKKTYHVQPHRDDDKKWIVTTSKRGRSMKNFDKKAEAVNFAKDLAKKHEATLVTYKKDGSVMRKKKFKCKK